MIISLDRITKIPRQPPGPSYIVKDSKSVLSTAALQSHKQLKHALLVLYNNDSHGLGATANAVSSTKTTEAV